MNPESFFLRPHIQQMDSYTPILPLDVLSAQLQIPIANLIKLDANENPYGASQAVQNALASWEYPHIYPDPESRSLRHAIAAHIGGSAEPILAGAGADELIDLIARITLEPNDKVINCPPTFGMYKFDTRLNAGQVVSVPRRDDFSLDVTAIRKAVGAHHPKILFLTSPNNPDGSVLPESELWELLDLPVLVVLDEAYIEFSENPRGYWHEVSGRSNLIVLRTFSKWAGLAGLRVGYGAFPEWILPHLWKCKQPYNVNGAAQVAAIAALADWGYQQGVIASIVETRHHLHTMLASFPALHPFPSQANFVLSRVVGRDAAWLYQQLRARGILTRYYAQPDLANMIRISVGREEHLPILRAALESILAKP